MSGTNLDRYNFRKDKMSVKEMQIADANTNEFGVEFLQLMECAGYSSAMSIINEFNLAKNDIAYVFCGTGNNGGDGFVVSRHLISKGIKVYLFMVGDPNRIRSAHARSNWNILNNMILGPTIIRVRDSSEIQDFKSSPLLKDLPAPKVIIDALLGTGVRGEIREPVLSAIKLINKLKRNNIKVASIDVPSGMDPNTGEVSASQICVEPDLLITFHTKKAGFDNPEAKKKFGKLVVNSIGILPEAELFVGIGDLKAYLPKRKEFNHKGEFGKVLVIGGSAKYAGAPALAAMAALQMGVDLVIVYSPISAANIIKSFSPNLIVTPGSENSPNYISKDDVDAISELIDWADSVIIGPGLGRDPHTEAALGKILDILADKKKPGVIDADGISLSVNYKDKLKKCNGDLVITPHAAEFTKLTKTKLPPQQEFFERIRVLKLVALNFGVTFLVKGKYDYIVNSQECKINRTGTAQMAVGGTGDILSGIVGALLALKLGAFKAAYIGAYISGKLGEEYPKFQSLKITKGNDPSFYKDLPFKSSDLLDIIPYLLDKYRK
ncbi:MAG: NAD(P)H-hydrate dehydratase [Promethearchaeota archaeon]